MKNELGESTEKPWASALLISLALLLAFLPAGLVFVMFAFFYHRDVPPLVLVAECIFSLACCCAPSLLLLRRHSVAATAVAVLFIPLNALISFFFGCTAMLAASH